MISPDKIWATKSGMLNSNPKFLCVHLNQECITIYTRPDLFHRLLLQCLCGAWGGSVPIRHPASKNRAFYLFSSFHHTLSVPPPATWEMDTNPISQHRCQMWLATGCTYQPPDPPIPPPQNTHRVLHSPVFSSPSAGSWGKQTRLGAFFLEVCYCQEETRPI